MVEPTHPPLVEKILLIQSQKHSVLRVVSEVRWGRFSPGPSLQSEFQSIHSLLNGHITKFMEEYFPIGIQMNW